MINIMMIEDNPKFAEFLGEFLSAYNIKITNIEDPYLALVSQIDKYDLLILDLTLPGIDGLELCKEISSKYDIPIIISSARGDITDKIIGFERGADDYLPKPYDPKEMYVRIMNLLKRYNKAGGKNKEEKIDSDFEIISNEIRLKGRALKLTLAEFEILKTLIKHHNVTLSREQIVNECESLNDAYGKSVDMIISRIRNKIGDSSYIVSVRGIGYKLLK